MANDLKRTARMLGAAVATAAIVSGGEASAASFTYSYSNPYNANADDYIHSTSNIRLYTEGTVRVWIPETGGATFATTTPGVIVYKFDFPGETVESAFLRTNNPTFHWSYSQGHNFFYGSKDGATWEQLLDVPPPAFGSANGGVYNNFLPASLLGGDALWFKAELYSYGTNVGCCGAAGRNTAQHSRWDTSAGQAAQTFKLEVDFAQAPPPMIPVPGALPLLAAAVGAFGLFARAARRKD
jgi:hypothetical protein